MAREGGIDGRRSSREEGCKRKHQVGAIRFGCTTWGSSGETGDRVQENFQFSVPVQTFGSSSPAPEPPINAAIAGSRGPRSGRKKKNDRRLYIEVDSEGGKEKSGGEGASSAASSGGTSKLRCSGTWEPGGGEGGVGPRDAVYSYSFWICFYFFRFHTPSHGEWRVRKGSRETRTECVCLLVCLCVFI